MALHYREPGHAVSPTVSWLGATTLLHSVWAIAGAQGVVVQVQALASIDSAHADRRALGEHLRQVIAQAIAESMAVE